MVAFCMKAGSVMWLRISRVIWVIRVISLFKIHSAHAGLTGSWKAIVMSGVEIALVMWLTIAGVIWVISLSRIHSAHAGPTGSWGAIVAFGVEIALVMRLMIARISSLTGVRFS